MSSESSKEKEHAEHGGEVQRESEDVGEHGYKQELTRNRSLFTLLFQSLAIAAIPYGEGAPLLNAAYGGGQLAIFLGWIVSNILSECTYLSLSELASRYPTSGGPSFWAWKVAPKGKNFGAYMTGWIYLVGNWTITLSVNFGFATLLSGTITMYKPNFSLNAWQLVLVFYCVCILTLCICTFFNRWLPSVDTFCAGWTAITIIVVMIALSVKADVGRHSASFSLGNYNKSFSGWGGFTFFIGLLPAAYTFSAVGMIASMAEEVHDPSIKVPNAMALSIPVGTIAGFFYIIPICVTLPPLADVINKSPDGQALPYIFHTVMGSPGGGLALMFMVLVITLLCSISITVAASRCTWAFARDHGLPFSKLWARVHPKLGVPVWSLILMTVIQMALGLINIGSSSAFTAFISVGVQALALSYAFPIAYSLWAGRKEVNSARWTMGRRIGPVINVIALAWIAFEVVLFSMPVALPVTLTSMNYASVVLVGFAALGGIWYAAYGRKIYAGPPVTDGL